MELEEDENAVEKFKEGIANIVNVLALHRLRQQVSLKEKVSKLGKVLEKRFTVGLVSASPDPGATVRLSYPCVACVQYMYMYVPAYLLVCNTHTCVFVCGFVCVLSASNDGPDQLGLCLLS